MAKYGNLAQTKIAKNLHEQKHEHKFKNRQQAIAVGISEARKSGGKVPKQGKAAK